MLLAAGFEAVFALHTAVERIGRYLQVFYERRSVATGTGVGAHGDGVRPRLSRAGQIRCSSPYFFLATVLNFVPVLLAEPVQTRGDRRRRRALCS